MVLHMERAAALTLIYPTPPHTPLPPLLPPPLDPRHIHHEERIVATSSLNEVLNVSGCQISKNTLQNIT